MKRKKRSFSKIAVAAVFLISLGVIVFSCWLMAYTKDASPLAYLVPSVEACLAIIIPFYLKKSQAENTKGGIVYDVAMKPTEGKEDQNEG